MDKAVRTVIDQEKCTGCGLCVEVCPDQTLSMKGKKAYVTGSRSIGCGHCMAVCPVDAVQVTSIDAAALTFKTFTPEDRIIHPGKFDTGQLVGLMRSRRSYRCYTDETVAQDILEDLVKIGMTAPSGTNSQQWTFTILPGREEVKALGERIGHFFEQLNHKAEKAYLRKALKLIGKPELDIYFHEYYEVVKEGLAQYKETGKDRLFHGATAAIVIGSKPEASCPSEDALLATQNILLAAHSMGLGTCLVGFAVKAMSNDSSIKLFLGIPEKEPVYAVIALGHPRVKYQRFTGRRSIKPRYFELSPTRKRDND